MSHLMMARALFGITLGYHIGYATISVGAPMLIVIAEILAAKTGQEMYRLFAKRVTMVLVLLVGVGLVTGTTVAVMLSVLWPGFMKTVGEVINLPFQIEVFAFMLESLFLAIYLYGGDRLSVRARIVSAGFVSLGSGLSALLITDVNAFMNTPVGFQWTNGHVTNANPWRAMLSPAMPTELMHVLVSAYMTVGFVFAAMAAKGLLNKKSTPWQRAYHAKVLRFTMALGGVMAVATAVVGDASGKFLAHYQPEKLAAAEGLFQTTKNAPLVVGGVTDARTHQVIGGIPIPDMLSFLATGNFSGQVTGLDAFPQSTWPPLFVHVLFDVMVAIGSAGIGVGLIYALYLWRTKQTPRWLLWVIVATGLLSMAGIEDGWTFAEIARQPWMIYGYLRVSQAVTAANGIGWMFAGFLSLYTVLLAGTIWALRIYFRKNPLPTDGAQSDEPRVAAKRRGVSA
ncbi:cytochrome ubiquinol oxidase subunit I [Alicyclobacillus curvatus]|nr:cytochrome ubiquinol oxidase subunit I [Alicyclobacillus curvatus]